MSMRRARGYTLVELMVTVSVLGIILVMAIPSLGPFLQRQRIKNAAMDMASTITLARSEAIKRNAPVYVISPSTDWGGGWTVASTSPSTTASTIRGQGGLQGVTIAEVGSNKQFNFGGDGRLQSSMSFTMRSSDPQSTQQPLCVSVSTAGRTQTTNGSCG